MENASKALLIAAGMIIATLIISALVVLYNQISSFYSQEHDRTVIEQKEKFNATYENYNGKTIRGNELISLMNRIIDYNNFQANMEGYEKIIINVDLDGKAKNLLYDETQTSNVIIDHIYNTKASDKTIKDLAELSIKLVTEAGISETKLQKLTEEIGDIVINNPDDDEKNNRAEKIANILGCKAENVNDELIDKISNAIKKYYGLRNFKKAMFKCENVYYDQKTARVNKIEFKVVVENGEIKLD